MRNYFLNSLDKFLDEYPGMSTVPYSGSGIYLKGKFKFQASVSGGEKIVDSYKLDIIVPERFPQVLPKVEEIDWKIPRNGEYHVNPDGTLCLGSPLRVLDKINQIISLCGFSSKCLVPFLYAVSYKLKHGGNFILGDLAHGTPGVIEDYLNIFGLKEKSKVEYAVELLGIKKRIANKRLCPCDCERRLGVCPFHHKLNRFRKMAPASWFKANAMGLS